MASPLRSQGRDWVITLCFIVLVVILSWSALVNYFQNHPPAELVEAMVALQKGKRQEAHDFFEKAIKAQPTNVQVYRGICQIAQSKEEWGWLAEYAKKGRERCPNVPRVMQAELLSSEAIAYSAEEPPEVEKAIQTAELALQADPKNPQYYNGLGYVLADNGRDLQRALTLLQQALNLLKDQPDTLETRGSLAIFKDSYGWTLYKMEPRDYHLVIDALEQAVGDMPEETAFPPTMKVIYYHLGAAYHKAGRVKDARQALQVSLKYDPHYAPSQKELNSLPPDPKG